MLLSEGSPVHASSEAPGHPASAAVEEDIRTWWGAGSKKAGEWLRVDLPAGAVVSAVQVNTYEGDPSLARPATGDGNKNVLGHRVIDPSDTVVPFLLEASADGQTWEVLRDARTDGRSHEFVELDEPRQLRHIRVTGGIAPLNASFSVSGLRVFGHTAGSAPTQVAPTAIQTSPLAARVAWSPAAEATGYNVRYGIAADKLYSSWQLGTQTSLDLRALNAGHDYWVAVDSFNTSGVTRGAPVKVSSATKRGGTRAPADDRTPLATASTTVKESTVNNTDKPVSPATASADLINRAPAPVVSAVSASINEAAILGEENLERPVVLPTSPAVGVGIFDA